MKVHLSLRIRSKAKDGSDEFWVSVPFLRILEPTHLYRADDLIRSGALGRASLKRYYLTRLASDSHEVSDFLIPMYYRGDGVGYILTAWDDDWLITE